MPIDEKLLNLHFENINSSLNRVEGNVGKLFERQDKMNIILAKNTTVMTQHHERSTKLEVIQEKANETLEKAIAKLTIVEHDLKALEKEVEPVKNHVEKINKTVFFLEGIPTSIKVIASIVVAVSSVLGFYFTYINFIH